MKKEYCKPEIKIIELRTEERLATCFKVYYAYEGSGCINFFDTDRDNCWDGVSYAGFSSGS